jgi:serine/threonine protein kinase
MSIGPFRLLSQLGEGGMGRVYLAVDGRCGRRVAVKCLSPGRRSAEFTSSLAREARLLSRLQHPHIVQLLEFNMDHDPPYLVLELAEEGSLRKVLKQRTLDQQQSVLLMAAVARAVHAAHESGVLHLDLKPENILLTAIPAGVNTFRRMGDRFGEPLPWSPKVADFGLCASLHGLGRFTEAFRRPRGTLAWMAPEQLTGQSQRLGRATDVYALGVILYELLTGIAPFRSSHDLELCGQICRCPPCPPHQLCPGISRRLSRICLRCLQKEPADRFRTAAELAVELESVATGSLVRGTFRFPRWPRFTAATLRQLLLMLAGFIPGAALVSGYSVLNHSPPAAGTARLAGSAATARDSDRLAAERLLREIREADEAVEYIQRLPPAASRSEETRRVAQFLWNALIRRSKELLSNSRLAHLAEECDPQTLLLARLNEVAGLAEDAHGGAAAAWTSAHEFACRLHGQNLLNERIRWRALTAARLLDQCLARKNRSSEGLQVLEDAWRIFGPETLGQPGPTAFFSAICNDFQEHLLHRQANCGQSLTTSGDR